MNVDFSQAVQLFFANYATFTGRSTRAEYWWAYLFCALVGIALGIFYWIIGAGAITEYIISGIVNLFLLLPNLAITWRRLHDVGKGGGWIFINLIPLIGQIWFLILVLSPSEGDNRFGPTPYPNEH